MKEKRDYSLTAKERKKKRYAASKNSDDKSRVNNNAETPQDRRIAGEQAMIAGQKRSRRSAIIVGAVVALAIVLIIVGMLVPVIAFLVNPYRNYKDVIAKFTLSNGMTLEYVIDEDLYDTAATNFIFLANTGYFDNTVFFDAQNGWLRFGGYEDQPLGSSTGDYNSTKHHAQNRAFCEAFKAIPTDSIRDDNPLKKFSYSLRPDKNGENVNILNQPGVLAYLYNDSTTEFQFAYAEQATNEIRSVDGKTSLLEPTMVGHALDGPDGETVKNINTIASMAVDKTNVTTGFMWLPPKNNSQSIYIRSVKVYNLDSSKWRNFDFVSYMKGDDEQNQRRYRNWDLKNPN